MAKNKVPTRQVIVRIPEITYAELITYNPQIIGSDGYTRYGAVQKYFLSLVNQDLERRKEALRQEEVGAGAGAVNG